ncbi:MAG TPA: DUF2520 domain-containing protein [Candidatus Acidoferrales bacterium]|nr:DUF2520 domain-containing protein [Candidatus Acidoferrales bacterium]
MSATIAIVGAGRLGRVLGRSLHRADWKISAVVTRSEASARSAVRAIGAGHALAGVSTRVLQANIVLITTPDDAIHEVAAKLARLGGNEWRGKVVLHTSGALDSSVLSPLARRGAFTGSLHPLQTFGQRTSPPLDGVVFAVQGDPHARRIARRIARAVGGVPVTLRGDVKAAYHAAGTLASPFLLVIVECAMRILMEAGFSRRRAKLALHPLVRQTLSNFDRFGAKKSWTGPVSRGDFSTVARHAAALAGEPIEVQRAYAALARLSARLLATHPEETLRHLDRALSKPAK